MACPQSDIQWDWEVHGSEVPLSPGSAVRGLEQSGTFAAEQMGDVLRMLTDHGEFWDLLDTDYPLTITITPAASSPSGTA